MGRTGRTRVKTMPVVWLERADDWVREDADMEWRKEDIRMYIRKKKNGEPVTFAGIAEEMNSDRHRGRRLILSRGGVQREYKNYAERIMDEWEFAS